MQDTTLLVLASEPVQVHVASALQSAAQALGHVDACQIAQLDQVNELRTFIFELDPWCVIAIDDNAIRALRQAFEFDDSQFDVDYPAQACGYHLVAVPGFAGCLDDAEAKRIAWHRMQAAMHPKNPLD